MDADALLRQIAPLSYPERQRRLAEVAGREAATPEWRGLLLDLLTRGRYERRCALLLAEVARDLSIVRSALGVGSPDERAHAVQLAIRLGVPAADLVAVLPELSRSARQDLVRAVRGHGTSEVADALLPVVTADLGDAYAAGILPACSSAVVAAELENLEWAVTSWAALGHRHPGVVLDHVDAVLATTPRALVRTELDRLGSGLAAAAAHDPGRVLGLVERCAPDVAVPPQVRRVFGVLARHDPARLAAVLLRPGSPPPPTGRALVGALLPLPDDVLGRLAAAGPPHQLVAFLRHLPPARRTRVHRAAVGESTGDVPVDVLDLLPWADRHALATRLLERHDVADDPDRRLAVVARLPFDQARPELAALTREPTAERRALGYRLLLIAARGSRDPDVVTAVLTGLTRLPNEQDPVRLAAAEGVAAIPGRLLTASAAAAAARVVADAIVAPDCSWATRATARRIATGLLHDGLVDGRSDLVDAGFTAIATLGQSRHADHLERLSRVLPRAADLRVLDALTPRCEAEARTGRFDTVLALAAGLGTARAARLPELQARVGAATRAKSDEVVRRAITMWLAPSATRDERVALVLAADRSTVTIHEVAQAVAARRSDLLDEVLRRPARGRFLARRLRFLPAVGQWSDRWTPAQVETFRTSAAGLAEATGTPMPQRFAAIRQLRLLPGSDDVLRRLVRDPDVVVAEAALTGFGMSREPRAVIADLLAVIGTDRSRVAVPALRSCLDRMSPTEVAEPLAVLLAAPKVTVRKDAVRLVVDLAIPDATSVLQRLWESPDEHRDVRRAVLPALRRCLDDERAWSVLTAAVADPSTASGVLDVSPLGVPPRHRGRWAGLLLVVATTEDDVVARAALGALTRWTRFAPVEATETLAAIVPDLTRRGRWRDATARLVQVATILSDVTPLENVTRALLAHTDGPADTDAGEDRDRPVRQRLVVLTRAVCRHAAQDPGLRGRLGTLVEILAATEIARDLAVSVAAASVAWDGDARVGLSRVVSVATTFPLAARGAAEVTDGLRRIVGSVDTAAVDDALAVIPAAGPAAAALVRLGVVQAMGVHAGWPPRWRAALRELRAHPDPDVVRSALDVLTVAE